MKVGERVRHRSCPEDGVGIIQAIYDDGKCDVKFDSGTYSSVAIVNFESVEAEETLLRLRKLLDNEEFDEAQQYYECRCQSYLTHVEFDKLLRDAETQRTERLVAEAAAKATERKRDLREQVRRCLLQRDVEAADKLHATSCTEWWPAADYAAERAQFSRSATLADTIASGSLADVSDAFGELPPGLLTADEMACILSEKTRHRLARTGIQLDDQQVRACAYPARNRLIRARAGSGKTRTLAALAALVISDERLSPDQVLTLAFNTKAAREIGERIRGAAGVPAYRNARTFHSLAYTLVGSTVQKLIGNQSGSSDPSTQLQSQYVERVIHKVLGAEENNDFRENLYQFFRKEVVDVERLGSHLKGDEYLTFRRSLTDFSLKGDHVKSNGEKFIADFLFEHGISYKYERVYSWASADRLDGAAYRPDFTLQVGPSPLILEHWAIDPDDPVAKVPAWWQRMGTAQYRRQIDDKRDFWRQRHIRLLETHTGMLCGGREAFEARLKVLLEIAGITCVKRGHDELVEAIACNRPAISRMAKLFVNFISRAKKRGWNVERSGQEVEIFSDPEPRNRLFHELASRAYAEYEKLLQSENVWDFDDLLLAAIKVVEKQGANARIGLNHNRDSIALSGLRWILIDEFQDFSELYHRLVDAIRVVNPAVRIVAVGDDWQAINAFAGSQLKFFEHFVDYFASGGVTGITTNYRSGWKIVEAGNDVMAGLGEPALGHKSAAGSIETCVPSSIYAGNDYGDQAYIDAAAYQDPSTGERKTRFDLARTFKACGDFIIGSVRKDRDKLNMPSVLLLSRTNRAYGLELYDFERRLRKALEQHPALQEVVNRWQISPGDHGSEPLVQAMTAHAAKGKEANAVIILQATNRNFPKVHADNQLFGPFGVTAADTLAEERRLFYVAVTRAERRLLVLTEAGEESMYLGALSIEGHASYASPAVGGVHVPVVQMPSDDEWFGFDEEHDVSTNTVPDPKLTTSLPPCGFAQTVMAQLEDMSAIDLVRNNISDPARRQLDRLLAEGLGVPEVGHFVGGRCAELAWPSARPPVAVLTGRNAVPTDVKAWSDEGWRVVAVKGSV